MKIFPNQQVMLVLRRGTLLDVCTSVFFEAIALRRPSRLGEFFTKRVKFFI